jgi:hypothetical protein
LNVITVYLAGLVVLGGAILANMAAGAVGLKTWYEVLKPIPEAGVAAVLRSLTPWDVAFLVFLYPAWLGFCAYVVLRWRG